MQKLLLYLINLYQKYFSGKYGRKCRFYPTCSMYAKEAILKYGTIKGSFLAIKRILKCNPFNEGGYDPVNKKTEE